MVDNQHKLIKGYRDLTQEDIDIINRLKDLEKTIGETWKEVSGIEDLDKRCLYLARTHLETGFMFFVKALAQPDNPFE